MTQVLPVEQGLRRVIGDGESVPDGDVKGLGETTSASSTGGSSSCAPTTSARSSTTARAGSEPTRSSGTTRRCRPAPRTRSRRDWIFPSYRESAIGLLRGFPPATALRGGGVIPPAGGIRPTTTSRRSASRSGPMCRTRPGSRGARSSAASDGRARVFGDGATSEGSFHEGANFAGVMKAPLVLFCNNNQWAISTPLRAQTAAPTLADKAAGYGMPGVRVDGTDVLAVYEATREAVARARAGDGPTFIEAVTYRAGGARHRRRSDALPRPRPGRAGAASECVGRFEGYLRRRGLLEDAAAGASGGGGRGDARGDCPRRGRAAGGPGALLARLRRAAAVVRAEGCGGSVAELTLSSRRSTTLCTSSSIATDRDGAGRGRWPRGRGLPGHRRVRDRSGRTAASTRRSPRPAFSAPPSASAWPAGVRSARCSTTPSATPASIS